MFAPDFRGKVSSRLEHGRDDIVARVYREGRHATRHKACLRVFWVRRVGLELGLQLQQASPNPR